MFNALKNFFKEDEIRKLKEIELEKLRYEAEVAELKLTILECEYKTSILLDKSKEYKKPVVKKSKKQ